MLAISDLDKAKIEQAELALVQFLQDEYPSLDLSKGRVLRDLLIRPAALFHALNEENMDRLRRSMSIQQISQDPTLANDDIVDGVLSNLLVDRDDGAAAAGQIRVIIDDLITTPVDSAAIFTSDSLQFQATRAFVGVTALSNVVGTSSRLITKRADGNYEFLVDVQALATGTEYNVAAGTRFTVSPSIPNLIDLQSAVDFAGGRVTEDNAALVDRVQDGLSPSALAGRSHIEALLRENYEDLSDLSIIGFGDVEMRRDSHNLFSVSNGGKVDIYARTAVAPEKTLITATCTMLNQTVKQLSVTLTRDTMAGVYDVLAVYREGQEPFTADGATEPSLVDGLDLDAKLWTLNNTQTGDEFVPDIFTSGEGAFTRYRQMVLTFTDPLSTLTNGQTATYQIYLLKMPDIASIQDFINDRRRRSPATDYLVRAPIPALCTFGISVAARVTGEVDADAIKAAVVSRINALGFSIGHLPGSVVIDAAQGQLSTDAVLDLPLNMQALMYLPDGTNRTINGTDELRVPDNITDAQVSARTVGWFARTADVDVSVREIVTPKV